MGAPGWPELDAWTWSADSTRIVLIAFCTAGGVTRLTLSLLVPLREDEWRLMKFMLGLVGCVGFGGLDLDCLTPIYLID
jgi:hypothetical protein